MNTKYSITTETFFTKNIFIEVDGVKMVNIYGDFFKFLCRAIITEQEKHAVKKVKIESQTLNEEDLTTENWQKFDKASCAKVQKLLTEIKELDELPTSPITITL